MGARLILLGAGGHAHVVLDALAACGTAVSGIAAPRVPSDLGHEWLGDDEAVLSLAPGGVLLVNGLGSVAVTSARQRLFEKFVGYGFRFADIVHPSAVVAIRTDRGHGVQVLAGAVVGPAATLGDNVIINTRAVVEHGCRVGSHSHVATGAILCGDVEVGSGVHVGAGAVVNQGVRVGDGATLASGAVVIRDVPPGALVAGVPAVPKQRRRRS